MLKRPAIHAVYRSRCATAIRADCSAIAQRVSLRREPPGIRMLHRPLGTRLGPERTNRPPASEAIMEQTSRPINASLPNAGDLCAFAFGPFRLHLSERSLQRHGVPVPLGGRAFDILALLVQRAGQVVRHDELIAHVWADVSVSPGTPRVHLTALRKVLGCRPDRTRYIANIPGRGYCFVASGVTAVASGQQVVVGRTHATLRGSTIPQTCRLATCWIFTQPPSRATRAACRGRVPRHRWVRPAAATGESLA